MIPPTLHMNDEQAARMWDLAQVVEAHPDLQGRSAESLAHWEYEGWEEIIRRVSETDLSLVMESAVAALVVALRATREAEALFDTAFRDFAQYGTPPPSRP